MNKSVPKQLSENGHLNSLDLHHQPFQKKVLHLFNQEYKGKNSKRFVTPVPTHEVLNKFRKVIKYSEDKSKIFSKTKNEDTEELSTKLDGMLRSYILPEEIDDDDKNFKNLSKKFSNAERDRLSQSLIKQERFTKESKVKVEVEEKSFENPIDSYNIINSNKNLVKEIKLLLSTRAINKLGDHYNLVKKIDQDNKFKKMKIIGMASNNDDESEIMDKEKQTFDTKEGKYQVKLQSYVNNDTEFIGAYIYPYTNMPEGRHQFDMCLIEDGHCLYIYGGNGAFKKNNIWMLNLSKVQ